MVEAKISKLKNAPRGARGAHCTPANSLFQGVSTRFFYVILATQRNTIRYPTLGNLASDRSIASTGYA